MSRESWIDLIDLEEPATVDRFTVRFQPELFNSQQIRDDLQRKLDQHWNSLLEETKNGRVLFNKSKFRLHSVGWTEENPSKVILNLGLTDYKSFICTQQQNSIEIIGEKLDENQLSHPLGVGCGLITSDEFFVLIKRGTKSIDLPGFYDIPGGHPEPE